MDFSIPGSDLWESTSTQDNLFKHDFQPKEGQSTAQRDGKKGKSNIWGKQNTQGSPTRPLHSKDTSQLLKKKNRKPKKKGRSISNEGETSTEPISNQNEKSDLKIKKRKKNLPKSIEYESNLKNEDNTMGNNKFVLPEEIAHNSVLFVKRKPRKQLLSPSSLYNTANASNPKKFSPKSKKRKFELDNLNNCVTQESDNEESTFNTKTKKLKLMKNLNKDLEKANNSEDSEAESETPIINPKTKFTKIKDTKEIKKQKAIKHNKQFQNCSVGNDEESDDEKIVSEIKNSSIYKEIQGLMKEFPSLQNLQDSDIAEEMDSSSDLDISESDIQKTKSIDMKKRTEINMKTQNRPFAKSIMENNTLSNRVIVDKKLDTDLPQTVNFPRTMKSVDFPRSVAKTDDLSDSSNMKKGSKLGKNEPHAKLQSAKFRLLNEKLYTETGSNAFQYFQENQAEFDDYHTGYNLQVSKWPMNPVDKIISDLQKNEKELVIVDMGCGDAKIARTLTKSTVHSFDIVALNDHVTACNISKVPVAKESVDIVVFCLSLMGTNFQEYLLEAHRILKMGGTLKIAEVESRMEDVSDFISKLKTMGFSLEKKDLKHKMFVFLDFKKGKKKLKKDKISGLTLKPCMYIKR